MFATIVTLPAVSIYMEADAGMAVMEVSRKHGISEAIYYSWKSKYCGMEASELKQMCADMALESRSRKGQILNNPETA